MHGEKSSLTHGYGTALTARPALYIPILLAVVLTTTIIKLGKEGIFSCQATGYTSDHYLAYCHATAYGDYEHGAFWFGLEPAIPNYAATAQVLFLGNSRMQHAFSTANTAAWFSAAAARYYLLGFGYYENSVFAAKLLRKLQPRATVYVINVDQYFEQSATPLAESVMRDRAAEVDYEIKRIWQFVHKPICTHLPAICGDREVIFRSRQTGAWRSGGEIRYETKPVSYDHMAHQEVLAGYVAIGRDFLSRLPVSRDCIILTLVPTTKTQFGTANALAAALGFDLVAPELDGLRTFDGSHLDRTSAERWSQAFINVAGPRIERCLDRSSVSQ